MCCIWHSHKATQGHKDTSAGVVLGQECFFLTVSIHFFLNNITGDFPVTLICPCHQQITSCLWHSDIFLLLSLVVAFTVTNMFTRTYSNPKEMRACGKWGCVSPASVHGVYMRYFYQQPGLSRGLRKIMTVVLISLKSLLQRNRPLEMLEAVKPPKTVIWLEPECMNAWMGDVSSHFRKKKKIQFERFLTLWKVTDVRLKMPPGK